MNKREIFYLNKVIQEGYDNIAGILVLKNDKVMYERYFSGCDRSKSIHIASVTKSVLSILIGIAIEKGFIESTEQYVLDYFPEYTLKRGEKTLQRITIRHLLTMTAPYKYRYEPYTQVYSSDDWTKSVLDLLGGRRDIGEFKYTTVGLHVLSGVLYRATKQSVLEFANEQLFKPLQIELVHNIHLANKDQHFAFLKGEVVSGWVADPQGVNTAGWGLTLTARDMAKIGQLYLNKGCWQDQVIVSSEWINQSTRTHSHWGKKSYGYLWWVLDEHTGCYAAIGDSGNIIYVSREKQLVIAITSLFKPRARDRVKLIKRHIEPLCH